VASKPLVLFVIVRAFRTESQIAVQTFTYSPDLDGILESYIRVVPLEANSTESVWQIVLLLSTIVLVQMLCLLTLELLSLSLILNFHCGSISNVIVFNRKNLICISQNKLAGIFELFIDLEFINDFSFRLFGLMRALSSWRTIS